MSALSTAIVHKHIVYSFQAITPYMIIELAFQHTIMWSQDENDLPCRKHQTPSRRTLWAPVSHSWILPTIPESRSHLQYTRNLMFTHPSDRLVKKKIKYLPPAVIGMTSSPPATLVPNNPSPIFKLIPSPWAPALPAPDVSAIQIPKNVPTKAPTAVKNWEPIAWDFVNPDLIRME